MALTVIDPRTAQTVEQVDELDGSALASRLARAEEASPAWRQTSFAERGERFRALADRLEAEERTHAGRITQEMGKPIRQAIAEVRKCAKACRHFAEHAEAMLRHETIRTDSGRAYVRHDPLGPVLAIMPWNYPYWQTIRFAAPALMAGNTALLKPASNTPGCGRAIEQAFLDAGFPEGVFQTLLIDNARIGTVIESGYVRGVSFTGSAAGGAEVAAQAAKVHKPTVMELGGSDPFIVLDDADIDEAARTGADARCQNSGQSCIAAKRFIVHEALHDPFLRRLEDEVRRKKVGDPMVEDTDVGPIARADLLDRLVDQVDRCLAMGATAVTGGHRIDAMDGYYFAPTVLTDVTRDMPAMQEELFGPVAAVVEVADEDEAIEVANDTRYGLAASIWTGEAGRGERLAARIDAGQVFINAMPFSDPSMPFGGIKDSGYGRELGIDGVRAFTNRKTVWVE